MLLDTLEAGVLRLRTELLGARKPGLVDRLERREELLQPVALEVERVERADREPAVGPEDTRGLGERTGPLDEMHDEPHQRPLEPGVLERQPLRRRDLDRAHALTCQRRHLRLGLDAPHARPALDERLGGPSGPAADVEHAPSREIALADEQLEDLPPVRVGRPQLVVTAGNPPKVRLRRRSPPARSAPRSRAARPRATPRAPAPSAARRRSRADRARPRTRARSRSRP